MVLDIYIFKKIVIEICWWSQQRKIFSACFKYFSYILHGVSLYHGAIIYCLHQLSLMAVGHILEQSSGSTMTNTKVETAQPALDHETGIHIHHCVAMLLDEQETHHIKLVW